MIWYMDASVHRITGNFTTPSSVGNNNWRVVAVGDYGRGAAGLADGRRHNRSAGLLSQAHASGCLLVTEGAIQIRGTAGARQVPGAETAIVSGQCGVTGINVCLIFGKHPN